MLSLPTKKYDETICKWLLVGSSVAQKRSSDSRKKERFPLKITNAWCLPYLKPKLTYENLNNQKNVKQRHCLMEDANEHGLKLILVMLDT